MLQCQPRLEVSPVFQLHIVNTWLVKNKCDDSGTMQGSKSASNRQKKYKTQCKYTTNVKNIIRKHMLKKIAVIHSSHHKFQAFNIRFGFLAAERELLPSAEPQVSLASSDGVSLVLWLQESCRSHPSTTSLIHTKPLVCQASV